MKIKARKEQVEEFKGKFKSSLNRTPLTDAEVEDLGNWVGTVFEQDLDGHCVTGDDECWIITTPEKAQMTTFENKEGNEYSLTFYSMSQHEKFVSVRTKDDELKQWYEDNLGGAFCVVQGPTIRKPKKPKEGEEAKEVKEGAQTHFTNIFVRYWDELEFEEKKGGKFK